MKIASIAVIIVVGLVGVALVTVFIAKTIKLMKNGIHNLKKCDDHLFEEIDQYKKCWEESNESYLRHISIINYYYRNGGEVDQLVENKEIERLYARDSYLSASETYFEYGVTCMSSVIISISVSFLMNTTKEYSVYSSLFAFIAFIISIIFVVIVPYTKKGHAGSFRYYINTYERELLKEKIQAVEIDCMCNVCDKKVLYTQQLAIEQLLALRRKEKCTQRKKDIERCIKKIDGAKLCLDDYSNVLFQEIQIGNGTGYLLRRKSQEASAECCATNCLINDEYVRFFAILDNYELIHSILREDLDLKREK